MSSPVLRGAALPPSPMEAVIAWLDEARVTDPDQATTCCLATADTDGVPDSRMVVARVVDVQGVVFCTHRDSAKVRQLRDQPAAALVFFWPSLMRQVRLRGPVEVADDRLTDALWEALPPTSRTAALASDQNQVVADRAELDAAFEAATARVDEHAVRPGSWVAYRLQPMSVELWQGHPEDRRHDRFRYDRSDGSWALYRLMP